MHGPLTLDLPCLLSLHCNCRNIPGEGFGDDMLQEYTEHRILTDADDDLFKLDEIFKANGGQCIDRSSSGSGGPPGGGKAIPSNLEKDDKWWRTIEYTYSPIWQPPAASIRPIGEGAPKEVGAGVTSNACVTGANGNILELELVFDLPSPAWAAVSFVKDEKCTMTPSDGSDGEVVYAQPEDGGVVSVQYGTLPASLKRFNAGANNALLTSLVPLEDTEDFSGGSASFKDGKMAVSFSRSYPESLKTTELHLSYAFGSSPALSYHSGRGCFKLSDLPACGATIELATTIADGCICPGCLTIESDLDAGSSAQQVSAIKSAAAMLIATFLALTFLYL